MLPVLYSFRRCPYAMRARLALAMTGCAIALREVSLKAKPIEMLRVSPKGTVPVLVLPNGDVIDESTDIMRWACGRRPGADGSELDDILVHGNDTDFKYWLDRYKYSDRHLDHSFEHSRAKASGFIMLLESRLRACPFLSGEEFGFLDAAIAPFVRQFSGVEPPWFAQQDWPAVIEWLEAFKRSELFSRVMVKYATWRAEEDNAVVYSW